MPDAHGNWPLPKLCMMQFHDDDHYDDIPPSFPFTLLKMITSRINSKKVVPIHSLKLECCEAVANSIHANALEVLIPDASILTSDRKRWNQKSLPRFY